MGVKLGDIIKRKQVSFEDLSKRIIAVDFSNSAYQFLSSIRQPDGTPLMDMKGRVTSHLVGSWTRFSNLMQQGVKLVIVFDGKMPALKYQESSERHERKETAMQRYEEAKADDDVELMAKYAKQFSFLTREMVEESKFLLGAMGLPCIQAPQESDAQMAFMNKRGDVWAVASSDFDSLVHGAPRMITNLTLSQKKRLPSGAVVKIFPELIELEQVLRDLQITQEQLIAIAILCGTDYNPGGIKGIGPKKALKLVKEYADYERMFEELNADFDWEEIHNTFVKMSVEKKYKLSWKEPDPRKIKNVLVDEHNFSEERVDSILNKLVVSQRKREQSALGKWL